MWNRLGLKGQRGSVTIIAFAFMLFLGIVLSGVLPMMISELQHTSLQRNAVAAQYASQAGLKRAMAGFIANDTNWTWLTAGQTVSFANSGGTYRVTYTSSKVISDGSKPPDGEYVLVSTGQINNAIKHSTVTITKGLGSLSGYALYANDVITFKKDTIITGNVGTAKTIGGKPPTYNTAGNPSFQERTLPDIKPFKDTSAGTVPSSGSLTLPRYYYATDSSSIPEILTNNSGAPSYIFVDGSADFSKDTVFTGTALAPILLVATGNVTFKKDATLNYTAIISLGNLSIDKAPVMTGAFFAAGTAYFDKDVNITYDSNVASSFFSSAMPKNWKDYY